MEHKDLSSEAVSPVQEKNPIQVADRLFLALELLCDQGPLGLMEISESLKLNKSTAHRVLNSLIYMGYASQDESTGKYKATFKLVDLANKITGKIDVVQIIRPFLRQLVDLTGETVHLVELDGINAVYIDKVESYSASVQMISRIGRSIPLYCSGVGKAMMSKMDDREVRSIWNHSEILRLTPYTITTFEALQKELEDTRERGYAMDNEENEVGVRCIAVCLEDFHGKPNYAFSISTPVSRMDNDRVLELAKMALNTKKEIEAALRYSS